MAEPSILTVVLMGLGIVFFGLICIIAISMIMSAIIRKLEPAAKPAPAPVAAPAAAPAAEEIPNRQAFVAAVSVAIAEELGTDVSGIRIHSIKKV